MEGSSRENLAFIGLKALPKVIGYLALLGLVVFFIRLYQVRMRFRRVQKEYRIVRRLNLLSLYPTPEFLREAGCPKIHDVDASTNHF